MKIRPYCEADSQGISDLMKAYFLEDVDNVARSFEPEYYRWKYKKNIFGKPVVWIAENDGKIISYFAILPRRFWMNGKDIFAGQHLDAFMHPDYQGKGIFRDIIKNAFAETKSQGMEIILGSPNKPTVALWLDKYRFKFCFEYRSFVRPLNFGSIINSRVHINILSKIFGFPFYLFYRLIFRKFFNKVDVEIEKIEKPDERIDEIWKKNSNGYTYTYSKTCDYLKWRFDDNPEEYDLYLIKKNDEYAGYFVVKFSEIKKFRFAHLIDLILPEEDDRFFDTALEKIIGLMKKQRTDMLSYWALRGSALKGRLRKFGFIQRKKEYFFVMKSNRDGVVIPGNIDDVDLWNFSHGDTDEI